MPAAGHYVLPLSLISFLRHLISKVAWLIVPKLCQCLTVTQIYKVRSEIRVALPPKFGSLKISNFGAISDNFTSRLNREYLRNATRRQKMALQTANTPAQTNLIWCTLSTNGEKNRTGVLTHPTGGHKAGQCHASSFSHFFYLHHKIFNKKLPVK